MKIEAISVLSVGSTRQPRVCSHPILSLSSSHLPCRVVDLTIFTNLYGLLWRYDEGSRNYAQRFFF